MLLIGDAMEHRSVVIWVSSFPLFPFSVKKMYRGCVVFDFFLSQLELPEIHRQNDVWSMDGFNTCCSSVSLVYWLLLPGILPASHNRSTNFN